MRVSTSKNGRYHIIYCVSIGSLSGLDWVSIGSRLGLNWVSISVKRSLKFIGHAMG